MKICIAYTKQGCQKGDKCQYSHDLAAFSQFQRSNGPCHNMALKKKCTYGLSCRFSHDLSMLAQVKLRRPRKRDDTRMAESSEEETKEIKMTPGTDERPPPKQQKGRCPVRRMDKAQSSEEETKEIRMTPGADERPPPIQPKRRSPVKRVKKVKVNKGKQYLCSCCRKLQHGSRVCDSCEIIVCQECYDLLPGCPTLACEASKEMIRPNAYLSEQIEKEIIQEKIRAEREEKERKEREQKMQAEREMLQNSQEQAGDDVLEEIKQALIQNGSKVSMEFGKIRVLAQEPQDMPRNDVLEEIKQDLMRDGSKVSMEFGKIKAAAQEPEQACDICYCDLNEEGEEPFKISTCSDVYHKSCLGDFVLSAINGNNFPIICPNSDCKRFLSFTDIEKLTSDEEYKKFNRFFNKWMQAKISKTTYCPNPDCDYYFEMQPGDSFYECIACKGRYCLQCNVKYHYDMSCRLYQMQDDTKLQEEETLKAIKAAKFQQCPNCNMWVERSEGCPHMTCRCGFQFCYTCGAKYGSCRCHQPY